MKWVLERFVERGRSYDSVCLILPTAPLIDAEDVRQVSMLYDSYKGRFGVLAVSVMPCPVEWTLRLGPDARIAMVDPENAFRRSQDLGMAYYDTDTIAFFPAVNVLTHPRAQTEFVGYVLPRYKALDIDNPEDLELGLRLYRGRKS
jgi:pseudaminic acid cytidylyltransferase